MKKIILISLSFFGIFNSCKKETIIKKEKKEFDYFSNKYEQESKEIANKISEGINIALNTSLSKREIFREIMIKNGVKITNDNELDLFIEKINDIGNIDNYLKYKNYNTYETDKIFNIFKVISNSEKSNIKENLQIFLRSIDENQIVNKDSFYKDINYMYYTILAVAKSLEDYVSKNGVIPRWNWQNFWRQTLQCAVGGAVGGALGGAVVVPMVGSVPGWVAGGVGGALFGAACYIGDEIDGLHDDIENI